VSSFGYPLTTTDFSSVAARMASSNADILFNMGYPADGLELTQEFSAKYHTSAKLWLASGANYVAVVSQLGAKSNGTIMGYVPAPGMPGLPAGFTQAYQEYKKKFNTDPNSQSWSGYTAVYFLAAALEKAKSTAGPALTAALKQVTLTHGHGNPYPVPAVLKFGQDNTLVEAPGYYTQVQNGASVLVYPSIADAAKLLPYAG
jgi:branched-chain amino acid transport system substrate-binding protein